MRYQQQRIADVVVSEAVKRGDDNARELDRKVRPGMGMLWFGPADEIPEGWSEADGAELDRMVERGLYAAIGKDWNDGDETSDNGFRKPRFARLLDVRGDREGIVIVRH